MSSVAPRPPIIDGPAEPARLPAGRRDLCALQARKGQPVTLMMFDLDHFKSINDRFGHATGDEALKVFAQVLGTSMRASDIMGRLGGEELGPSSPATWKRRRG